MEAAQAGEIKQRFDESLIQLLLGLARPTKASAIIVQQDRILTILGLGETRVKKTLCE